MRRPSLPVLLFAGCLLALPLLAQPGGGPGPGGGGPFAGAGPSGGPGFFGERLAELLDLTPEQREQWEALHQELRESVRPLFEQQRTLGAELRTLLESSNPDPAEVGALVIEQHDIRRSIQAAHERVKEQLEGILTAEQLDRFEAFRAGRMAGRRGHHRRHGPGFGGRS